MLPAVHVSSSHRLLLSSSLLGHAPTGLRIQAARRQQQQHAKSVYRHGSAPSCSLSTTPHEKLSTNSDLIKAEVVGSESVSHSAPEPVSGGASPLVLPDDVVEPFGSSAFPAGTAFGDVICRVKDMLSDEPRDSGAVSHFESRNKVMNGEKSKATRKHIKMPWVSRNVNAYEPSKSKKKKKKTRTERDAETVAEMTNESIVGTLRNGDRVSSRPYRSRESYAPHQAQRFPSYSRRVEGLIHPSTKDVLEELEPPAGKVPVPTLAHGLDRVLFNPGVHWVQDPRSRVYNFTPLVQTIPDIKDFAFERLTPFVKSSRDDALYELAVSHGKRFAGSTSSLSGLLSHIYFLISQDHPVDLTTLSKHFSSKPATFTPGQRIPAAVVFNHRNGVYLADSDSTDADNDDSQWNILMWMGTMLEKFLTLPKDDFTKLLRPFGFAEPEKAPEAYRYSKSGAFVMRSQLDCYDARLPGSGVFDIKTRAALPIRLDKLNFKENSGYLIKSLYGPLESFEKEYYDLIRSAFLKYSFQARIGNMDGIFIAYHNTARIAGFQYVPLEEMDERLFGAKGRGQRVFNKCVGLLEIVASEVVDCFPGKSVVCLAETYEDSRVLSIWVQPVEEEQENVGEDASVYLEKTLPIVQLDITTDSFLDETHASGQLAVGDVARPWTLHWSVSRSALSEKSIRRKFEAAKQRKFRPHLYPSGVDPADMEGFLRGLGFGNFQHMPSEEFFAHANGGIETLRRLSRAGRRETELLENEERPEKAIWRQPDYSDPNSHCLGHPAWIGSIDTVGETEYESSSPLGQEVKINDVKAEHVLNDLELSTESTETIEGDDLVETKEL